MWLIPKGSLFNFFLATYELKFVYVAAAGVNDISLNAFSLQGVCIPKKKKVSPQ